MGSNCAAHTGLGPEIFLPRASEITSKPSCQVQRSFLPTSNIPTSFGYHCVKKKDHTVSFAWQAEAVDRGVAHYVASENTSAKSHSTVPASSLYTPMRYLGCYVPGQALTSFLKSTCVFFFPGGVLSQELTFLLKSLDSWEDHPPVCP